MTDNAIESKREYFVATVVRKNRKSIYKNVGLPYSSIDLDAVGIGGIFLVYGKTLHELQLVEGDVIEFMAINTGRINRFRTRLERPTKIKRRSLASLIT